MLAVPRLVAGHWGGGDCPTRLHPLLRAPVPEALGHPRESLDVGEEERDGAVARRGGPESGMEAAATAGISAATTPREIELSGGSDHSIGTIDPEQPPAMAEGEGPAARSIRELSGTPLQEKWVTYSR